MSRIPAELIYRIDRIFRRPRVGGRESTSAYSEWEYRTGTALVERYSRFFSVIAGRKLLDIGCGLGGKTVVYAEKGAQVTGVDIDPLNCRGSASFAAARGRRVDVACGDALSLPFSDGSFDFVVANDSMEHFSDPAKALGEIARVTRKGGSIFIFFTPWGSPLGSHLYDHIRTPWCHHVYGEGLLEDLLELSLREKGAADPVAEAAAMMKGYREENNRIDIAGYRRILKGMNGVVVEYEELIPPKFRFLAPLAGIPRLGEYFTGTVVSILRKTV